MVKVYCYLILAVVFLIYYQRNPTYTLIIVGLGIGLCIFAKAKKQGRGSLGPRQNGQQLEKLNNTINLLILLQLLPNDKKDNREPDPIEKKKTEALETRKNDLLRMLGEDTNNKKTKKSAYL